MKCKINRIYWIDCLGVDAHTRIFLLLLLSIAIFTNASSGTSSSSSHPQLQSMALSTVYGTDRQSGALYIIRPVYTIDIFPMSVWVPGLKAKREHEERGAKTPLDYYWSSLLHTNVKVGSGYLCGFSHSHTHRQTNSST